MLGVVLVSLKYKLMVLAVVISLVAAVLIITNQDPSSINETETEQITLEDSRTDREEVAGEDGEFKPANDPYQAYLDAGEAGRPAVIKFYARW